MSTDRPRRLAAVLLVCAAAAACGKKGPPLPPFQRVPGQVSAIEAQRFGDTDYLWLTVPTANVDGRSPADLSRIEIYAFTADRLPAPDEYGREAFRQFATLVDTQAVRAPAPPPPPVPEGAATPPPLPVLPGVDQGAQVLFTETLTDAVRTPQALPVFEDLVREPTGAGEAPLDPRRLSRPVGMPGTEGAVRRFYFAVGVSPRGRYGPVSPLASMPVGPTSPPPPAPAVTWDETSLTIRWEPSPAPRTLQMDLAAGEHLPARPVVPQPDSTRYNVYEVTPDGEPVAPPPPAPPAAAAGESPAGAPPASGPTGPPAPAGPPPEVPRPLNAGPLSDLSMVLDAVEFGTERCFYVRPFDTVAGYAIDGPASATTCVTPKDTYAPAAPQAVAAIAASGAISLIWQPNTEADLAGYLVLRGTAPGDTLRAITDSPITETTFRDETVEPGVRYTYVVVAVDRAGNVSVQSARVEETARQ
ncbi:MAG: hypothetical protein AB7O67_03650 [Vicinamibacterales bacterium]